MLFLFSVLKVLGLCVPDLFVASILSQVSLSNNLVNERVFEISGLVS